jgi:hypothetical protein
VVGSASSSFLEDFPLPLVVLCVAALLVLLFLGVTAAAGPKWGGAVTGTVALVLLVVWKRATIAAEFAAWRRRAAERKRQRAELAAAAAAESRGVESGEGLEASAESPGPGQTGADVWADLEPVRPDSSAPPPVVSPTPAPVHSPPPQPAADEFAAGLAERYRPFLMTAMSRSEWDRAALRQEAQRHRLDFEEALRTVADWSRGLYGDPVLVEQGDRVRVQLPLL